MGPTNSKLTFSSSVKGKKGIARSKEHQTSFRILERPNAIPLLQSNSRLSSSSHCKPAIGDGTNIEYKSRGVELSNTNLGNGKGAESDLSTIGEERLGKNVRPESAERTSLHVGVSGSSRRDTGGVRDEEERVMEKDDMLYGEQGDHNFEFDGPAFHGEQYSQTHSDNDDRIIETICDIAAGQGDRMLFEGDEGLFSESCEGSCQ